MNSFNEGYKPFECSEEELQRLTQLTNDNLVSGNFPTRKKAAEASIATVRKERQALKDAQRQALIVSRESAFLALNITCTSQGYPEQTASNYITLLSDERFFEHIAKDEFSGYIFYGDKPITDADYSRIFCIFSDVTKCALENRQKINDAIMVLAERNKFNQVKDYLDALTWDQEKRIETMFSVYLGTPEKKLYSMMAVIWMIAAVKRIYEPGCKFDNVLILQGKQGIIKSTFLEKLGYRGYKDGWYSDSSSFEGRDSLMNIHSAWIINMDEITAMNKHDAAKAKDFISRTEDGYRDPYGRVFQHHKRSCIFAGTTNEEYFLKDNTALTERRFWVVPCLGSREESGNRSRALTLEVIDQLWAEGVFYYKAAQKEGKEINLWIPNTMWDDFAEEQKQYKIDNESEVFAILDDALNRDYTDFTDDFSFSRQYKTPDFTGAVRKRQDRFTSNAINLLMTDNHIRILRGDLARYAKFHPDEWEYKAFKVDYRRETSRGLIRIGSSDESAAEAKERSIFEI